MKKISGTAITVGIIVAAFGLGVLFSSKIIMILFIAILTLCFALSVHRSIQDIKEHKAGKTYMSWTYGVSKGWIITASVMLPIAFVATLFILRGCIEPILALKGLTFMGKMFFGVLVLILCCVFLAGLFGSVSNFRDRIMGYRACDQEVYAIAGSLVPVIVCVVMFWLHGHIVM
ncbi:MAG: hypothetical protein LBR70_01045 [Lactobacillaceae bacterium]|jgi:hypothetical protein|nr:hypothetical protein [Lactobacillaceae bacterium]